jgi:uncharacterized protein
MVIEPAAKAGMSFPPQSAPAGQRIAVIGSGIAGMTTAYLLQQRHQVHLFEAAERLGGHTATQTLQWAGQEYAIDTGFIVYNDWTYPNFIRLLRQLGIDNLPTEMGFSVLEPHSQYEYSGTNLNSLFAQRKNLLSLSHWRMLLDILRFNREATAAYLAGELTEQETLADYLTRNRYSAAFTRRYLVPMGSAIWSCSTQEIEQFSVYFFVRFFHNHGLLSVNDRPQWRVIKGGSSAYIPALTAGYRERIRTATPILGVRRTADSVVLRWADGSAEFDQVVFACHSDQALALLEDANHAEEQVLGAIAYRNNRVCLHRDTRLLPKAQCAWASWNYLLRAEPEQIPVLTYNMNILQRLTAPITFCVTLNDPGLIDPALVFHEYSYAHPVFSAEALQAQSQWSSINGNQRTWFAGAYWFNGFHEDGVNSAIRVAAGLGVAFG